MFLSHPVWEGGKDAMDCFRQHLVSKLREHSVKIRVWFLQRIQICVLDDNGDTIVVRGCALDSGTLTTDTEIVRMSHCGGFYYDNRYDF